MQKLKKKSIGNNLYEGATELQNQVIQREKIDAAGGGTTTKPDTSKYDASNIDKLLNNVTGDRDKGEAVKTTSADKNLLSDEDVKLFIDVATRDYKLNYQQVTPNITLKFGDIRETTDVDDILNRVADELEEIFDADLDFEVG